MNTPNQNLSLVLVALQVLKTSGLETLSWFWEWSGPWFASTRLGPQGKVCQRSWCWNGLTPCCTHTWPCTISVQTGTMERHSSEYIFLCAFVEDIGFVRLGQDMTQFWTVLTVFRACSSPFRGVIEWCQPGMFPEWMNVNTREKYEKWDFFFHGENILEPICAVKPSILTCRLAGRTIAKWPWKKQRDFSKFPPLCLQNILHLRIWMNCQVSQFRDHNSGTWPRPWEIVLTLGHKKTKILDQVLFFICSSFSQAWHTCRTSCTRVRMTCERRGRENALSGTMRRSTGPIPTWWMSHPRAAQPTSTCVFLILHQNRHVFCEEKTWKITWGKMISERLEWRVSCLCSGGSLGRRWHHPRLSQHQSHRTSPNLRNG